MLPSLRKVNSQGQVGIPANIRKKLGLNPGDYVDFELRPEGVLVKPLTIEGTKIKIKIPPILRKMQQRAKADGTADLTMEEIDGIISEVRQKRRIRPQGAQ